MQNHHVIPPLYRQTVSCLPFTPNFFVGRSFISKLSYVALTLFFCYNCSISCSNTWSTLLLHEAAWWFEEFYVMSSNAEARISEDAEVYVK
jgi:hypothetical protein